MSKQYEIIGIWGTFPVLFVEIWINAGIMIAHFREMM